MHTCIWTGINNSYSFLFAASGCIRLSSSASGISLHGSLASMNCGIFERILPFSAEMGFMP